MKRTAARNGFFEYKPTGVVSISCTSEEREGFGRSVPYGEVMVLLDVNANANIDRIEAMSEVERSVTDLTANNIIVLCSAENAQNERMRTRPVPPRMSCCPETQKRLMEKSDLEYSNAQMTMREIIGERSMEDYRNARARKLQDFRWMVYDAKRGGSPGPRIPGLRHSYDSS